MAAFGNDLDGRKKFAEKTTYYFTLDGKEGGFVMRGVRDPGCDYIPVASMPLDRRVTIKNPSTGEITPTDSVRQIGGILTTVTSSDNASAKAVKGQKNMILYFSDPNSADQVCLSTSDRSFPSTHLMRALANGNVNEPFLISLGEPNGKFKSVRPFVSQYGQTLTYPQILDGENFAQQNLAIGEQLQIAIVAARKQSMAPANETASVEPTATPVPAAVAAVAPDAHAQADHADHDLAFFDRTDDDLPSFDDEIEAQAMRPRV